MGSVRGNRSQPPRFSIPAWHDGARRRPLIPLIPLVSLVSLLPLLTLLCAVWAGNAAAVEVIFQGPPGASGLTGATPGAAGGNGQAAPPASQSLFSNDPSNVLVVTGGGGGNGGNGAPGSASNPNNGNNPNINGGNAGAGGGGGNVLAELTTTLAPEVGDGSLIVLGAGGQGGNAGLPGTASAPSAVAGNGAAGGAGGNAVVNGTLNRTAGGAPNSGASGLAQVVATAVGGRGGLGSAGRSGGVNGPGGAGGDAISHALANSGGGGASLLLSSIATGGAGAAASGEGGVGGLGGAASATATLDPNSTNVPDLTMLARATGGRGGDANLDLDTMRRATGGNGGAAVSNTLQGYGDTYTGRTLTLSHTASGGAGGDTIFGNAGNGGDAASVITLYAPRGALSVTVSGTAVGGKGGDAAGGPGEPGWGAPGVGGVARSQLSLYAPTPASGGWETTIVGTSTATAGMPGTGAFAPSAEASAFSYVAGHGSVTSSATATGSAGGDSGGTGSAQATAVSNYIAIARANGAGGSSLFNPGAPGLAYAVASSAYHASADAVASSGSGRFGTVQPSASVAEASVVRIPGGAVPPSPSLPSEARAHALSSQGGGRMDARSSYLDEGRAIAVIARAATAEPAQQYLPEGYSAANVGGAAYAAWDGAPGGSSVVVSYAGALPTAASVAPLIASSAEVAAAFSNAGTLAAGTMGALLFPFTGSAQFNMPFAAGSHLLLGLVQPFSPEGAGASFDFTVSNGAVALYSASFTSSGQAAGVFGNHVLDLGVINANTLDLMITFTLQSGIYGFSYLVGQGGALPVPEPGTWMLMLAGLALLAWRGGAGPFANPFDSAQAAGGQTAKTMTTPVIRGA